MEELGEAFEERFREIESYLELLDAIEQQVQTGPPRLGKDGPLITADQQRILYSSVYLQLYNLIEATITRCIEGVCVAAANGWYPSDLSAQLRREWVRFKARTHVDLNYENRLKHAFELFEELSQGGPISVLKIEKGGGNWDDSEIEGIARRIGFELRISQPVRQGVKRAVRNEMGPLALVKALRNDLAHGSISFVECGNGATVADLRDLTDKTAGYLREVVTSFAEAIAAHEFLLPERRPPAEAPA